MKTLYLDLFSGISGDMFLGALIDVGVDFNQLEAQLRLLPVAGYHLHSHRTQKSLITGTRFDVHLSPTPASGSPGGGTSYASPPLSDPHSHEHVHTDGTRHSHPHTHDHGDGHDHQHGQGPAGNRPRSHDHAGHESAHSHHGERSFADIRHLIESSALSEWVRSKAIAIFQRIADAEGRIHGVPPHEVHFHEVGAVDSIIDIVGACIALEQLAKPRLLAGPVVEGTGWIDCAHGRFPIPAPATLAILAARQIPFSQCAEPHELVTPTGAALLAELVDSFGPMRNLRPTAVGYGLGTRDHQTRPNVLRVVLAETETNPGPGAVRDWEIDVIAAIEANLDDTTPEILGHFLGKAMDSGALDVCYAPIQMKKNRPGIQLTLLCHPEQTDQFAELILTHTAAFGVRIQPIERRKLRREIVIVPTPLGEIALKVGRLNGRLVQASPEYESARALADKHSLPLATVYATALRHFQNPDLP
jgi:hypothetical protein